MCANYDQIDKQNIEMFREYGTGQSEEDLYKCVICGKEACIENSMSFRGHRLIHTGCANKAFGYGNILEAFKWVEDWTDSEIIKEI